MSELSFSKESWNKLISVCESGYPKEVCGILFSQVNSKQVSRVEVLDNILDGKHRNRLNELLKAGVVSINEERALKGGNFEFLIDPKQHFQVIQKAMIDGYDQIGLFHSHPDHPPIPSPTDQAQPFLAGWSNVIVRIKEGKFDGAKSWFRETESAPFLEEKILV